MKKILLLILALTATAALAEKPGFKQYTGSYNLSANGATYTVIVARDGYTTILGGQDKDPMAGKVKFWKGRQEMRLLYPKYTFKGFANSLDLFPVNSWTSPKGRTMWTPRCRGPKIPFSTSSS
ncbi:hypothetical protein IJS98_00980 [bacterium]|nr:hypothetical protein [bacterium]